MLRASSEVLEEYARAALDGDRQAFGRFTAALWPYVEAAVRRSLPPADRRDEAQEIFTRLLERFDDAAFRELRSFDDWKVRHPEKTFVDWIRIILANLSRDRVRERVGRRPALGGVPSAKRVLNELAQFEPRDMDAYRPPVTTEQTAREILQFASEHLPPLQARALSAWIEGRSFNELRESTGVDTEEAAVRLVRAAIATLRRHFAEEG